MLKSVNLLRGKTDPKVPIKNLTAVVVPLVLKAKSNLNYE
jgi:hypothetical protein